MPKVQFYYHEIEKISQSFNNNAHNFYNILRFFFPSLSYLVSAAKYSKTKSKTTKNYFLSAVAEAAPQEPGSQSGLNLLPSLSIPEGKRLVFC